MMYRVIHHFFDLMDGGRSYVEGDEYPRPGLEVGEARINNLLTASNKRGMPLIEEVRPRKEAKNDEASDTGNAKGKPGKTKQRK